MTIKVVVHGAMGKVGKEVVSAASLDPEINLVGAVDINIAQPTISLSGGRQLTLSSNLEQVVLAEKPDVLVDFSNAKAVMPAARIAAGNKVNLVIGTTGLSQNDIAEIDALASSNHVGAVIASNFALGAVLMMHLSKISARYFDYAEIIELHHHMKADSPSGTALSTAREMSRARGKPFNLPSEKDPIMKPRGEIVEGVPLHSVRLPGLMAHQEVIFGTAGQTLTIRHDTINRECYTPGVLMAVKYVVKHEGLTMGLATILGLAE